jgi:hypothetical protein
MLSLLRGLYDGTTVRGGESNYELRQINYELRITNYDRSITNYELRITGTTHHFSLSHIITSSHHHIIFNQHISTLAHHHCELRITNYELRAQLITLAFHTSSHHHIITTPRRGLRYRSDIITTPQAWPEPSPHYVTG